LIQLQGGVGVAMMDEMHGDGIQELNVLIAERPGATGGDIDGL
jgi:hypothetical protein